MLPIFKLMQQLGNIEDAEMFRAFNMGVGLVAAVSADAVDAVRAAADAAAVPTWVVGHVAPGTGQVLLA